MSSDRYRNVDPPPTLEEYRLLEAEGRIRRPLTDEPMQIRHEVDDATPALESLIDAYLATITPKSNRKRREPAA